MSFFGSCSGRGIRASNIIYPRSLPVFHDLLPSHSYLLILLGDFPSRYPGEVVCRRSMLNDQVGACVGWSRGS